MTDINERVARLEQRLSALEYKLGLAVSAPAASTVRPLPEPSRSATASSAAPAMTWAEAQARRASTVSGEAPARRAPVEPAASSATTLMAWAAGFALLLAVVYFLKLVYDAGWLTPERQVLLATLGGLSLIAAGFAFARVDRQYAAYLPAAGLIVLFLTVYSAHLYYHLWSSGVALVAVGAVTLLGIGLGRRFNNSTYAPIAAAGIYLSPLLMAASPHRLLDVIIHYSAWSLVFSFCALHDGRRTTYTLPMLFSLIGFDLLWKQSGAHDWSLAVTYQLVQFVIFAVTAAVFTIRYRQPLSQAETMVHGVALFLCYGLEYSTLHDHVPAWAPVAGILSAMFVLGAYFATRAALKHAPRSESGALLVSSYCSMVAGHVLFIELIPHDGFAPSALVAAVLCAIAYSRSTTQAAAAWQPVLVVAGIVFLSGFLDAIGLSADGRATWVPLAVLAAYALVMYLGYWKFRSPGGRAGAAQAALYGAHFASVRLLMGWTGTGLTLSMALAVLGVVILVAALRLRDRALGQSALLIFGGAGLKVLLFDLDGSPSIVRIVTLVVLAASLYVGGWLYQSLTRQADAGPSPA